MIKNASLFLILPFTSLLFGCVSHNSVALKYAPAATIVTAQKGSPAVTVGSFTDERGVDASWLGAIRSGYGNPLKQLDASPPVSTLVKTAFADGLRARGFSAAADGRSFQISGVIKKFDCSQYVRREAHGIIEIAVADVSGKVLFRQTYTADEIDGSLFTMKAAVFGSVEDLRAHAEKTLRIIVDKALDDTALRNSMQL